MLRLLLLVFILVPVIEIYLLITVGSVIGALWTTLLVVGTAIIGIRLLKEQGVATLARLQTSLQQGQLPAQQLLEGMMIVVAGALLLTPGFVTDAIGFLLLTPPLRLILLQSMVKVGTSHFTATNTQAKGAQRSGPQTLEGEFNRHDDE